jgi:hypothetical protein
MKTKTVLLAVMMSASLVALANEPGNPRVRVVNQKETGIYTLIYAGGKAENVKLNISNGAGQTLFNQTIKSKEGFVRALNFTNVEQGDYTITIESDDLTEVRKVSYVTTGKPDINHVHVAKLMDEGKYLFTMSQVPNETVHVKIFDGLNNVVHEEMIKIDGSYGVVYNLKQIAGNPTFEVTAKSGSTTIVK